MATAIIFRQFKAKTNLQLFNLCHYLFKMFTLSSPERHLFLQDDHLYVHSYCLTLHGERPQMFWETSASSLVKDSFPAAKIIEVSYFGREILSTYDQGLYIAYKRRSNNAEHQ